MNADPYVELMTVEGAFDLGAPDRRITTLLPNFSVPDNWKSEDEEIRVVRPDGIEIPCLAAFDLSHFRYTDPDVPIEMRWRVTVSVKGKSNADIPIGSKILVRESFRNKLFAVKKKTPSNADGVLKSLGRSP